MGGFKKGIWIARDQNGELYAYVAKPNVYTNPNTKVSEFVPKGIGKHGSSVMWLPSSWCKNIKFENSPVFVPITEDFVKQFIKN